MRLGSSGLRACLPKACLKDVEALRADLGNNFVNLRLAVGPSGFQPLQPHNPSTFFNSLLHRKRITTGK